MQDLIHKKVKFTFLKNGSAPGLRLLVMIFRICLIFLPTIFYSTTLKAGEVYIWKDQENVITITNDPPTDKSKLIDTIIYTERSCEDTDNNPLEKVWSEIDNSQSRVKKTLVDEGLNLPVNTDKIMELIQKEYFEKLLNTQDKKILGESGLQRITKEIEELLKDHKDRD